MNQVTLCLTIGRRPILLKRTLESLISKFDFKQVIAINDFRDEPSNAVFKAICPNGLLLNLAEQVGHHKAVDAMYSMVKTPFIFHCEDDWLFDTPLEIDKGVNLLISNPNMTSVCYRKLIDFHLNQKDLDRVEFHEFEGMRYARLDGLHDQWHGYTFNPHLIRADFWRLLGGFSSFKKERHVSRWVRSRGGFVAYLESGPCFHIGDDDSVSNPAKQSLWQKMKDKFHGKNIK